MKAPPSPSSPERQSGYRLDDFRPIEDTKAVTVPTLVAESIYAFMTASVAMRRIGCTIINTDHGNAMNFPKVSSHSIATNQRPALSCDTVTMDGVLPAGSGRDHTMSSGPSIFASVI